ncbi:response regulator transcription factor [Sporosarcina saromensis]|uniref:Response regulator transcription factor n=1 Tax=Sporosarcina saromensis TaxID=359365 RepID=A0ABU4GCC1_9BACL|nr:response regulator transcription factor [Sporosarcina saromensis]MDW0114643.1 response regulator transcription factor [Sporosarcina saromensis]
MIHIVIAEDQQILRGALGTLLDFEEDFTVVGQAENGEQALQLIHSLQPDVCILDIEMPKKSGLDVAEMLQNKGISTKVIILTTFARPGYFERAMKAKIHGYLLKDGSITDLANAIRNVMAGKREFAADLVMNFYHEENPLTEREKEVLLKSAEGKTAKEIGAELFLSAGTVRNYMSEVLQKVEAKNKVEAIAICREKGWI